MSGTVFMPDADSHDERLFNARVELLYETSPTANLFMAAVVALIAGVFWGSERSSVTLIWASAMISVCILRYLLVMEHRRRGAELAPPKALRRYFVGVVLAGCGWAAASLLLLPGSTVWHQYLVSLGIAGVAAAGMTVNSPSRPAVVVFLGLTLVPLAVVNLVAGDELNITLAAMVGLYLLVLLRLSGMQYDALLKSLRLRYENQELVEEMQRAKLASEKINSKLKAEIAVRSRTEADLIEARDKAEQAARAKSDFLATMSHEIRTPMNGVLGMSELLINTELSAKQHRFADTIRRSGEALLAIINDVLDFSKIEAGKLEIQHTVFDLRQLCEDTAAFFAAQAQLKGLDILCVFPADEHAAYRGDPERIRQVLNNLIGNAIKFTERGQVVLSAQAVERDDARVMVRCEVLDTGIGIRPDHMDHIFDEFSQADASTTRSFGGTGLGLSISARLVGLMGGEIGVGSTVGKGSKFWFTVSLTEIAETAIAGHIGNPDQLEGLKALIVDDNETNRDVLGHQLDAWNINYDSIAAGRQSVPILESALKAGRPYDLVIVDRQMPEMDGMEVARAIKKHQGLAQTPVIMLSSINQLEATSQWFQAGVDYYVNKPVRQAELFDAICSVTGKDIAPGE
ncbi:MAG: response regulator, partial [Gammaproteobacteria bacterium]|nr:response regulator [Gammaproteobacteria bacterium]